MNNTQIIILLALLVAIYLYWKYYSNKTLPLQPEDIIERKGKAKQEVFWDTQDWEINSDHD